MLHQLLKEQIVFLDIETVPEVYDFKALDPYRQELWEQKTAYKRGEDISAAEFYKNAGIWAEFGKIVCISLGYFTHKGSGMNFRVTSLAGDEADLLMEFSRLLGTHFRQPKYLLCAHNGKEFDFPYIARRMLIKGLPLPSKLNLFGKKPWEIPHLDTMELWKFGDFKHYTSLKLLAEVLGIPSPKEDMDGSMVRDVYYQDQDTERIIKYCELDVVTLAQVFLRLRGEELLAEGEISYV